jgi:hypothetical protein
MNDWMDEAVDDLAKVMLMNRITALETKCRNLEGMNAYLNKVHSGYATEHDRLLAACDGAGQERDLALEPRIERLCARYKALEAENKRLRERLEPPARPLDMDDPLNKRLYKAVFGKSE